MWQSNRKHLEATSSTGSHNRRQIPALRSSDDQTKKTTISSALLGLKLVSRPIFISKILFKGLMLTHSACQAGNLMPPRPLNGEKAGLLVSVLVLVKPSTLRCTSSAPGDLWMPSSINLLTPQSCRVSQGHAVARCSYLYYSTLQHLWTFSNMADRKHLPISRTRER